MIHGVREYKFSASQISTFLDCQRKWAFDRIAKVPRSQHPSAALGTRCHSQLERYLTTGETPLHSHPDGLLDETGAIVEACLDSIPPPMAPTLEVEKKFLFQSDATGFWYNGFIDWRRLLEEVDWCEVGDHKSTGNLAYAKKPQDLHTDPQGVLYAYDTLNYFGVNNARLHWNYISTKRPYRHLPVITGVTRSGVAEAFTDLEETATEMAGVLDTTDAEHILDLPLPVKEGMCHAYGGCPYRFKCNLSPLEGMRSIFHIPKPEDSSMAEMTALERLRARQAGTPPAPAVQQMAADTTPALGKLPEEARPVVVPCTVCKKETVGGTVEKTVGGYRHKECDPFSVPTPGTTPTVGSGAINPPESSVIPTQEQLVNAQNEEKQKRHRRTKAEMEAARVAEASAKAPITDAATPEPTPVQATPDAPQVSLLLLDCLPTKGLVYQDAAQLIAMANKIVCEAKGVNDYRYVEYIGGAMLAEAAMDVISKAPRGLVIYLDSSTPEGKLLVNPLSNLAQVVIRG